MGRDDAHRIRGDTGGAMTRRRTLDNIIDRAILMQTLFVLAVIAMATLAIVLERSLASDERNAQTTLLRLETFEFQVLNAETGFRGYALAHKPAFLDPYREAFPAIAKLKPELTD